MSDREETSRDESEGESEDVPGQPGTLPGELAWHDAGWERLLAQLEEQPSEEGWVTLDEAAAAAGVARSTLRSWYRTGAVPSRMVAGPHGPQRLLQLDAVLQRALRSSRVKRQMERSRSLESELDELRRRVATLERYLGLE